MKLLIPLLLLGTACAVLCQDWSAGLSCEAEEDFVCGLMPDGSYRTFVNRCSMKSYALIYNISITFVKKGECFAESRPCGASDSSASCSSSGDPSGEASDVAYEESTS